MVVVAGAAELPQLLAIENAAFTSDDRWSEQLWRDELGAGGLVLLALTPGGEAAACAAFRMSGDTAELLSLAALPTERRHGYAARCLSAGIDWARSMDASEMLLEVRADNEAALALYRRFGFETLTIRKGYYRGADALVLRLPLTSEANDEHLGRDGERSEREGERSGRELSPLGGARQTGAGDE